MNKGRYEQLSDPASLYERPRTRFVAGFLGVSNLIPTTPRRDRRQLRGLPPRRRHRRPCPGGPDRGPRHLRDRRPTREGPPARTDRRGPRWTQPDARDHRRRVVHRRLDELRRGDEGQRDGHGLRTECRSRDSGRAVDAGRGSPSDLVARPHVRRRSRRRPAAGRRDRGDARCGQRAAATAARLGRRAGTSSSPAPWSPSVGSPHSWP